MITLYCHLQDSRIAFLAQPAAQIVPVTVSRLKSLIAAWRNCGLNSWAANWANVSSAAELQAFYYVASILTIRRTRPAGFK